jgi:hypothetical protein
MDAAVWILVAVFQFPHGVVAGDQIEQPIAVTRTAEACSALAETRPHTLAGRSVVWRCEWFPIGDAVPK